MGVNQSSKEWGVSPGLECQPIGEDDGESRLDGGTWVSTNSSREWGVSLRQQCQPIGEENRESRLDIRTKV